MIIYPLLDRHDDLAEFVNPNFEPHIYGEEADLPFDDYAELEEKLQTPSTMEV